MKIEKLTTTDAFVAVDLDGAPRSTGVVRLARKVLADGAQNLARSLTYAYASHGMEIGGASAGINAEGDDRADALAAFVAELQPRIASGELVLDTGKGVSSTDLAAWSPVDTRDAAAATRHDPLLAAGVVAGITAALGSLDGTTVAIEASSPADELIAAALTAAGATATIGGPETVTATADAIVVGSKVGLIAHEIVPSLACRAIVASGPLPITARALADARKRGILVLPDFVTTSGPLLAQWPDAGATDADLAALVSSSVTEIIGEVADHPDGHLVGACIRAEAFLRTWRDELPFGRPIA